MSNWRRRFNRYLHSGSIRFRPAASEQWLEDGSNRLYEDTTTSHDQSLCVRERTLQMQNSGRRNSSARNQRMIHSQHRSEMGVSDTISGLINHTTSPLISLRVLESSIRVPGTIQGRNPGNAPKELRKRGENCHFCSPPLLTACDLRL